MFCQLGVPGLQLLFFFMKVDQTRNKPNLKKPEKVKHQMLMPLNGNDINT